MNWTAGVFLSFYICLALGTLLTLRYWREHLGPGQAGQRLDGLDPVQLGYLAGGFRRAADTVLVGLFEAEALQRYGESAQVELTGRLRNLHATIRPYAISCPGPLRRARFHKAAGHIPALVQGGLAGRGLIPSPAEIWSFRLFAAMLLTPPVLLGVGKMIVGSERGHPVGYLAGLVVLLAVLGSAVILNGPYRTQAGSTALARMRREQARALRAPRREEILTAFALTGVEALAGCTYKMFFQAAHGGGGASGCGGGGGGCGGGCGGCGG